MIVSTKSANPDEPLSTPGSPNRKTATLTHISNKSANPDEPISTPGSPNRKTATLTHSQTTTDTLVLYEPCVRPSVLGRISRSASLGRLCQSSITEICQCVAKECIDKAVQTEKNNKNAIYLAAASEPPEQTQATREGQSDARSPAITSRSESHESARYPSPSTLSDSTRLTARKMLARRRGRVQSRSAAAGGTSATPRSMPMLDWSTSTRQMREDQRLRSAVRKRALFVVDIDLAAVLSFVIACAMFVAVVSIAQQMFWPSSATDDTGGYIFNSDRGYFEQHVYN